MMIAENYNDFVDKSMIALMKSLNSGKGQKMVESLLQEALKQNPNLTPDEWGKMKQQFIMHCFYEFVKSNPDVMQEMGLHLYNELKH